MIIGSAGRPVGMVSIMVKRRLIIAIALGMGVVGAIVLVLSFMRDAHQVQTVPGRGEILYRGHPASYWREQMRPEGVDRPRVLVGAGDPDAMPVMAELLRDEDESVRIHAAHSLSTIGPKVREVLPRIHVALRDPVPQVRMYAAVALGGVPPQDDDDTVKPLAEALQDPEICVRIGAAKGLARMGPGARSSIPALEAALRDEDHYVAVQAALALYKIGGRIDRVLPVLIDGLKDPNSTRRKGAAQALKELGPNAEGAVPALINALADEENVVAVVDALGAIGPRAEKAVPALLVILNKQGRDRWWIDEALRKIDPVTADKVAAP